MGTACTAAGWAWGALLVAFFVVSTALSRWGAAEKERRTGAVVSKGGERDATQVLANGGLFALAAVGSLVVPHPAWPAAGAGALAAATADTWGTEVGGVNARPPRLITTGRTVPPGTSGGVTLLGLGASVAGALFISRLAALLGSAPAAAWGALAGGVAGALADSLLGATLQLRRRCPRCEQATERAVHGCGSATRVAGGVRWLDNDAVNLASGAVGLVAGALCAAR